MLLNIFIMGAKITKKISRKIDKLTTQWIVYMNVDAIEEEIKRQLYKMQSKVHINGFRDGKAPIEEVDKIYGEDALYRAVNSIIHNSINEIVKEEKYDLAMQPEVAFNDEIKRKKDISVSVKFVKKPEIQDIKYEKIEVKTVELELSEKDKEDELLCFRKQLAKPKLVEDTNKLVENGDDVDIDFVGRKAKDNVEFAGGSAKGYRLEIGSHTFINGFEEQIIGHKKGETFDIKVKFPEVYPAEELKGKDAIFKITINDIYTKELPEINDDFIKGIGFDSVEKLKELLFGNIKNYYDNNARLMLKDEIFTKMIDKNKVDLPDSIIEQEVNDSLEKEKENNKDNTKWNEKEAKKRIEDGIRKSYASFYLTEYIAKKNSIEVSEDEIKQSVTEDAIRNKMNVDDALDKVNNDEKIKNYISFTIKEAKVFDFIYDNIKKKIKKLDKESFEKYISNKNNKKN